MRLSLRALLLPLCPLLLLTGLFLAGCDTTDPVPPTEPVEVAGTYDVTAFRFDPDRTGILGLNLLDSLNADVTVLELRADGQFLFIFQFDNDFPDDFRGTFTASRDEVRLMTRDEDLSRLPLLLLSQGVTFERQGDTGLVLLDDNRTVDLESYDEDVYGGIAPQTGTLTVRLTRRETGGS